MVKISLWKLCLKYEQPVIYKYFHYSMFRNREYRHSINLSNALTYIIVQLKDFFNLVGSSYSWRLRLIIELINPQWK